MKTVHEISALRQAIGEARRDGRRIALVPTMGNLHEGHLQLVREALAPGDFVVTSIFVNPMQFGPNEDLDAYPRTLAEDQDKLAAEGCHLVFAPSPASIYPQGLDNQTQVSVPGVSEGHCGESRPGHFTGVATVVNLLFNLVQPDRAYFGEKDFQQLAVIRKMVRDLFMPIEVIGVPTVREADGLAMSSRNGYLSAGERRQAPILYQTLKAMAAELQEGNTDFDGLSARAQERLREAGMTPDYVNVAQRDSLRPARPGDSRLVLLAAAWLGRTRLIDNLTVTLTPQGNA